MLIFYVFIGILYLVLMSVLWMNWQTPQRISPISSTPKVTVLVPFRNEQQNISASFHNLKALQYPDFEIIWIDDFSEDRSLFMLEELIATQSSPLLSIRIIQSEVIGKKAALTGGLELSNGEIIMTTDADCLVPKDWISQMTAPFANPEIKLVAGPVMTDRGLSFFQKFQQIEWASILAVTQMTFHLKKPLMCSGANLAYRKSAFLAVRGYEGNLEHLSGDDEFLLKKIISNFGKNAAVYLHSKDNLVYTQEARSWTELFQQRIRWASKWNVSPSKGHIFAAIAPFLFQLFFLASVGLLFMGLKGLAVFLFLWLVKLVSERVVLGLVLSSYQIQQKAIDSILTSLVHPFYVLTTGLGVLRGKFVWKGRESLPKH
ncbi:glycosyltransferase [Rhodonellum sp.]|uniref:glycosyltransferase n=1 Tax=Rhodonellum sp. TaxID=2231180 RepID=UPI00271BF09C|nr:glycosyltransferase [Rhodonellum sp.]MDO9551897.1 glycosyltransferase [Rhodonellum sp.]